MKKMISPAFIIFTSVLRLCHPCYSDPCAKKWRRMKWICPLFGPVDQRTGGYRWTASDGSLLISPAPRAPAIRGMCAAEAARIRGLVPDPPEAIADSQDGSYHDLQPELAGLDHLLAEIASEIAAAWQ